MKTHVGNQEVAGVKEDWGGGIFTKCEECGKKANNWVRDVKEVWKLGEPHPTYEEDSLHWFCDEHNRCSFFRIVKI